ncbi:MAG: SDR family NAD(P)-dependent oxidoreductase [Polyangiaceae bacterium]|nr:SDR family NAD(P)-dependent oxidoreductase [Polyangiaceae bacterium]
MRVLVTGASGFLGGHVVERLSERGDHVRALVRQSSNRRHLERLANVELFEGSVEQVDRVREAVDGVDAIVHVAGVIKARSSDEFFAVNVGGTSNLVQAACAAARAWPFKRFVHVSSLEACGPSADGRPVPVDQEKPVTAYGRSKLTAEKVVLAVKDELPVTILRPGAIYGPRDNEILEAFRAIQRGVLPIVDGGHAKGVWIYATDCADACIRAIDASVPSGRIYFVDDGCGPMDQRKMLGDAERALGRHALVRASLPVPVLMTVARGLEVFGKIANRPVMLTREKANMLLQDWVCSSADTERELGWQPKVPWDDGVRRTVGWYRENGWL